MSIKKELLDMFKKAKSSTKELAKLSSEDKNKVLIKMSQALIKQKQKIINSNRKDLKNAKNMNLSSAMIDRLKLDEKRIKNMADCLKEIAELPDYIGQVGKMRKRPNGLKIGKVVVPIGVIGIIYESRPNVTSDCIGLCLKSGNAVILRGGKESINSNIAIFKIMYQVAINCGLPEGCFNIIETTDRKAIDIMLKAEGFIDLIIPRGGENLIKTVTSKSRIPVIKHYKGVCHTFVDETADINMAIDICYNAKVQKPSVCNAMETMLVHKDIAKKYLPIISKKLLNSKVQLRGCKKTIKIIGQIHKATENDWYEEYLDLKLSVKVVNDIEEAIEHISKYGSKHSDAIITGDYNNAFRFLEQVDSACVYVNASTRFTDGNQFGLGAEMGVSTDKIHARGPMGMRELTTYKYIILGNGQIRK